MNTRLARMLRWMREHIGPRDVATVIGLVATMRGLALIYRPSAWVFLGLFTLYITFRRPKT